MELRHIVVLFAAWLIVPGWPTGVVSQGQGDDSFEDASDICSRCACSAANASASVLGYDLLDCSRRNLRRMLANWPPEFDADDPDREVVFSLSGNAIGRLQQLPATRNALVFSCRHCQLDQLDGGLFLDAPHVYRVDLSWNRLSGEVLAGGDVFRGQYDGQTLVQLPLDELDLSNNNISRLTADTFRHVTGGLRGLALAHNPLAGELAGETGAALAVLVHLEVLDLSYLALTAIDERVFAGMLSLHELSLQGNQLLTVPAAVYRAPGLVTLNLAENPFVELRIEQALPNLRHLNVSSMPWLGQIAVESFTNVKALRTLLCRSNRALSVFDMAIFSHLPELRKLDLSHSELKHLVPPPGTGNFSNVHRAPARYAEQLETLRLSGNTWHCDCELRAALILFGYDQLPEAIAGGGDDDDDDDNGGGPDEDDEARCETPYMLTSLHLADLPFIDVCDLPANEDHRGTIYEKPAFLRPRAIFLSLLSVGIVIGLGFVIGLAVVCLKRKLNHTGLTGFTSSPVRYTSVRDSTISAAYQQQA
ncbi:nyctalopin-like [Anopheles darlingi]|uniref:nyctalopin-like n=1 Tax=Anopheles darlingi TaxID=43151 RepID=UPI00210048A4|nr:nyctalopin-like [Anopheles darlingi]